MSDCVSDATALAIRAASTSPRSHDGAAAPRLLGAAKPCRAAAPPHKADLPVIVTGASSHGGGENQRESPPPWGCCVACACASPCYSLSLNLERLDLLNSGEGWWIFLSVIDVGKISCTMARAGARAPRARMFITSQVPFHPTQQYAISCTGCRSTTCSNHKKPFKITFLNQIPVLWYRGYRYLGTFMCTLYTYQLVL
jgi:hypothetical protein